jgi:hypothetical protein
LIHSDLTFDCVLMYSYCYNFWMIVYSLVICLSVLGYWFAKSLNFLSGCHYNMKNTLFVQYFVLNCIRLFVQYLVFHCICYKLPDSFWTSILESGVTLMNQCAVQLGIKIKDELVSFRAHIYLLFFIILVCLILISAKFEYRMLKFNSGICQPMFSSYSLCSLFYSHGFLFKGFCHPIP